MSDVTMLIEGQDWKFPAEMKVDYLPFDKVLYKERKDSSDSAL